MKSYFTINDVLRSPWADAQLPANKVPLHDRILQPTRLETEVYLEFLNKDSDLEEIIRQGEQKLLSFSSLSQDIFQSLYSLTPRRCAESELTASSRKFNVPILDHVMSSENYPTMKAICEGRALPAYEAAEEFISKTAGELDDLLSGLSGEKNALDTLETLEAAQKEAQTELTALLDRMCQSKERNKLLEEKIVEAANKAESKRRQVEAVSKMIDTAAAKNREAVTAFVDQAMTSAIERAEETQNIIGAWSDNPGNFERSEANKELLALVKGSDVLKDISKYLGRFREIFAQGKRNGYAYGRGEKYALELGNNLSRAITSELAMLATPQTLPLFLRKYQSRQIKQYQRREPVYKGMGDIICCLDESDSTRGDAAAWGKAVALTLLEIAAGNGRSFALIHFSGRGSYQTDLFRPGACAAGDKLRAAETFLGGGTNFQTPMEESLRLITDVGFENADIVFITDGECSLPDDYLKKLQEAQAQCRFSITGILLDKGHPGMDFSLKDFCQTIYRTSEMLSDDLVRKLVAKRLD